jgi:hypothetical protein
MEAEVFLLGHWKNYEDLETSLSLPELIATLEASRNAKWREQKFSAALQGVTLPDPTENSFDEIQRRAEVRAAGGNPDVDDITNIRGGLAAKEGFGIQVEGGLSYDTV